ncbi:MAG: alpha/beta hydrolase [Comamonadaceae bacterium]|nr:alpha/beta hydrolase [Comamonadaceae bacterium]
MDAHAAPLRADRPDGAARRLHVGGVDVRVEGDGEHSVVFVHGWPDSHRLWDGQVAALSSRFTCARFTLPGFAPGDGAGARSLDQIVDTLAAVVDAVGPDRPVVLVLHDWGCFFGYRYAERHPQRVRRIVGIDIGDAGSRANRREMGWLGMAASAAYQLTLAAAWRVGGRIGNLIARSVARLFRAPQARSAHAAMGWPYAVQWFGVAGGFGRPRAFEPPCPMLYVYGQRKPFHFHSSAWARRIAERPGCRVVGMAGGHWVMRSRAEAFNALLLEWLDEAPEAAPRPAAAGTRGPSAADEPGAEVRHSSSGPVGPAAA